MVAKNKKGRVFDRALVGGVKTQVSAGFATRVFHVQVSGKSEHDSKDATRPRGHSCATERVLPRQTNKAIKSTGLANTNKQNV